jgi:putative permease
MNIFRDWFKRYFTDPQIMSMILLLVLCSLVILTMGKILAPILASVLIAYLLDGLVVSMERAHIPRFLAVILIFLIFMVVLLLLLFGLLPALSAQVGQFVRDLPSMFAQGKTLLMHLPSRYPDLISERQVAALIDNLQAEMGSYGQNLLAASVASVRGAVTVLVYLVLMPLMIFFFLKDKQKIFKWFAKFLPENRNMSRQVWSEVNLQFGNYLRGKFWEVLIVWTASFVTFSLLGLKAAMLLGLLVGISVLVPYIGATVITFPVALMGFSQWGASREFVYLMVSYAVIQLIDGNLLSPLLLSEVVDLHPTAIVTAVLVFGGLWGFWGVLFAIPLATLVQAVIRAWMIRSRELESQVDGVLKTE